ncbi:hypothetical protein QKO64_gp1 [Botrytis cinerea negative-stranded RNA virus 7]|uniref:Uncharacterized protein n=1 Tax=Botrytis cinerea negative-stranded RNA virus 7 TaxID=2731253 RepID=A0A7D5BAE7_9MONO|nr:hypothetical protein QKO64_gp1 [Botrytis cinerea negative-stranded RNA virus 7]QKW91273.1 hypothetical protein [Botrytis cinerea negative-stranded RNA virus 7]
MGISVLTKLMMMEKQVRALQQEKDRLAIELMDARLEVIDLEERLVDLSYLAADFNKIAMNIEMQTTEREQLSVIKFSMDKMSTENELLIKENKELRNDMTYINQRLDYNVKQLSSGEHIVPQSDDDLNFYGYDATKLANDESATTLSINPDTVPSSKAVSAATHHFKKKSNKYSDPLGHRSKASESWIVPASKHEPAVHEAHYMAKKRYPDCPSALKKPYDMSSKYRKYNDKHPNSRPSSRSQSIVDDNKTRVSTLDKARHSEGRIPVKPSIDLSKDPFSRDEKSRKQSTVSQVSSASSTTLGRVSPRSKPGSFSHHRQIQ